MPPLYTPIFFAIRKKERLYFGFLSNDGLFIERALAWVIFALFVSFDMQVGTNAHDQCIFYVSGGLVALNWRDCYSFVVVRVMGICN